MSDILIIKHIDIEGPGSLEDYLIANSIAFQTVDLSQGDSLPPSPQYFRAIIVLGGPMNVYEEDQYPFLREEDSFIFPFARSKTFAFRRKALAGR